MYAKLSLRNAKRQFKSYLLYFVSILFTVSLLFSLLNLRFSPQIQRITKSGSDIEFMFRTVTVLAVLVTTFVLAYASVFMIRLRKRELGTYLTLGMTKRDIRRIYAEENCFISFTALCSGCILGIFLYQFFMALISKLLDIEYVISQYSFKALLMTVGIMILIQAFSMWRSLQYLKKATIYELIYGKKTEHIEKHSGVWCIITFFSLALYIWVLNRTRSLMLQSFDNKEVGGFMLFLLGSIVLTFWVHFSLAKALAGTLLKSKRLRSKSTNIVVLRELSEKMTANATLLGLLAVLVLVSIVSVNIGFTERAIDNNTLNLETPFDVIANYRTEREYAISKEEGRAIIEEYVAIADEYEYSLKTDGRMIIDSHKSDYYQREAVDRYMELSVFNELLEDCGWEPITLTESFLVVVEYRELLNQIDLENIALNLNGKNYSFGGCVYGYPSFSSLDLYIVVPDEAVEGMDDSVEYIIFNLASDDYDVEALDERFILDDNNNYMFRLYNKQYMDGVSGVLIISMLFLATVFTCMALALLSLKTLSDMEDDKYRYAVLFRLGVSEEEQRSTLLRQNALFFFMPAVIPCILSYPCGKLFDEVFAELKLTNLVGTALPTTLFSTFILLGVYLLYFAITFNIETNNIILTSGDGVHGSFFQA